MQGKRLKSAYLLEIFINGAFLRALKRKNMVY